MSPLEGDRGTGRDLAPIEPEVVDGELVRRLREGRRWAPGAAPVAAVAAVGGIAAASVATVAVVRRRRARHG